MTPLRMKHVRSNDIFESSLVTSGQLAAACTAIRQLTKDRRRKDEQIEEQTEAVIRLIKIQTETQDRQMEMQTREMEVQAREVEVQAREVEVQAREMKMHTRLLEKLIEKPSQTRRRLL
ncbi:hypothetical protein BGX26_008809 [Mortierella sp. AD094]|nr:hypothetical protein BGX26_008809 [Mortierella sp. AD094]